MKKNLLPLAAAFIAASATYAMAGDWASSFKTLDTDGSGTVSRTEFDANLSKLKLDPAPQFSAIDADDNNSIDDGEWAKAEKMTKNYSVSCKASNESWCPKK
ncbi:hypothetical protein [Hyphomicrobium sp.]|uniref:hypothetical protein n=1 Tax=Hyphomicrobium sp. TaxID=82 RepID=UPI000F95BE3C|nr:hypothetical protein [Hyphomicrobium sp.]RUP00643.1 MAG: hypothetical protein EKK30_00875 [Hyphomicrobium sp.]